LLPFCLQPLMFQTTGAYICIYTCVCGQPVHIYVYIHVCVCVCVYTYIYVYSYVYIYVRTYVHMFMYLYAYGYMCVYICTYICTNEYYIYIYTHSFFVDSCCRRQPMQLCMLNMLHGSFSQQYKFTTLKEFLNDGCGGLKLLMYEA
jgi:hypothetical protein